MIGETTTDISNHEQVTVIMRRAEDILEVHEEYLRFYCAESIGADSLAKVIKDTLLHMKLSITKLRGQYYDGCNTMSGTKQVWLKESVMNNLVLCSRTVMATH